MANKRTFKCFVEQDLGKIPCFLIYAVLEWMLIIMLFLDGFIAFAANEFARFFELKTPCLLCTRIDHALVHKRDPDFYYNESICEPHKKDVSSLAYCHVHKRLSDIKKMCEGCLLSFATEREADTDTYKSLVGILHKDVELLVDDDQEVHHLTLPSPTPRKQDDRKDDMMLFDRNSLQCCSCCGEPLKVKAYSKGKNANGTTGQAPAPSPRAPRSMDLPHLRYTELKFISDDSSEQQEDEHLKEDGKATSMQLLADGEELTEDKTPNFCRGNKYFGIPFADSAQVSPRFTTRFGRKSPLEKLDEATRESLEGQVSNDADGDSILQNLKRQVRLDKKSLMALYMELDEERSASAVAANNAMAMITRLQADKAAVQMEALQYQRMMEEQAEYDQEALQAMNNLLIKREEEIKDLEAEIDAYREQYGCLREEDENGDNYGELRSESFSSNNGRSETSSSCNNNNNPTDGEKSLTIKTLTPKKSMERKVHFSSDSGPSTPSSKSSTNMAEKENPPKKLISITWDPPVRNWIKLSVDGSRLGGQGGFVSSSGVLRDGAGNWKCGFARNLGTGDVVEAELWAILKGLQMAWDDGHRLVMLEFESTGAMNLVLNPISPKHPLFGMVSECKEMLNREWRCQLRQVSEEANVIADGMAKLGHQLDFGCTMFLAPPFNICKLVLEDVFSKFLKVDMSVFLTKTKIQNLNSKVEPTVVPPV